MGRYACWKHSKEWELRIQKLIWISSQLPWICGMSSYHFPSLNILKGYLWKSNSKLLVSPFITKFKSTRSNGSIYSTTPHRSKGVLLDSSWYLFILLVLFSPFPFLLYFTAPTFRTTTEVLSCFTNLFRLGIVTPTTKNLIVVTQVIIDVSGGLGFQQIGTDIVLVDNPTQVFVFFFLSLAPCCPSSRASPSIYFLFFYPFPLLIPF